ncbi:MAG: hypothetical protein AB7Y46_08725 [Armatimonadota bacterium]
MSAPDLTAGFDPAPYAGIGIEGARALADDELNRLLWSLGSLRKLTAHLKCARPGLSALYKRRGLAHLHPAVFALGADVERRSGDQRVRKGDLVLENLRRPDEEDVVAQVWDAARSFAEAMAATSIEQDTLRVSIETDLPVLLAVLGDLHLGAAGVDYLRLLGLLQVVAHMDGVYVALNGDLIEGMVALCPEAARGEQLPVRLQRRLADSVIDLLRPRTVAVTEGQHEYFAKRAAGVDYAEELARRAEAAFLGPGGGFWLRVGEVEYHIGMWHKYPGASIYDETAAAKRCCREHGPFDVTIVCDHHTPAVSHEVKYGDRKRAFLRGGTAKTRDPYARSLGYMNAAFEFPCVILWPDAHQVWAETNVALALETLTLHRQAMGHAS